MKNTMTMQLSEIKIQNVGAMCILLVSKFSRVIKAKHGITVQLRDPNVLNNVAAYAEASTSAELKIIYQQIEIEIRKHLMGKGSEFADDIVFTHQSQMAKTERLSAKEPSENDYKVP